MLFNWEIPHSLRSSNDKFKFTPFAGLNSLFDRPTLLVTTRIDNVKRHLAMPPLARKPSSKGFVGFW